MFFLKRQYSNKTNIISGLISAFFLSLILYLEHFNFSNKYINSLIALVAIYKLLKLRNSQYFYAGFFTGIFWFYWIGISFIYYDMSYLIPLVTIGIGIYYGIIFYLFNFISHIYYKAIYLFLITTYAPFGFDWFKLEVLFANSVFDIHKEFIALLIATVVLYIKARRVRFLVLIPLYFALTNPLSTNFEENIKVYMPAYNTPQELKWEKSYQKKSFEINFSNIEKAISEKYDLIILPETVFTTLLNKDNETYERLQYLSKSIKIVTGGLYFKNDNYYNSTYFFDNEKVEVAQKVVLVPFGEEVPFPAFIRDFINNTFYNGAKDYEKADKATNFEINKIKFRNAICYEATNDKVYENLDGTKNVIAISNNAWFTPSIMPTLQKLLMQYYSKKYNIKIYHQVNGSDNFIITPNQNK